MNSNSATFSKRLDYRQICLRLMTALEEKGHDVQVILQDIDLSKADLKNELNIVRGRQFINLLRVTKAHLNGDELFGMTERPAKSGSIVMLIHVALACDTLEAMLEYSFNFLNLICDDVRFSLEKRGDDAVLGIQQLNEAVDRDNFLSDYLILFLHRTFSWCVGHMIPVKQVGVVWGDVASPARIMYLFGDDWQRLSNKTEIVISAKYLALPILRTRNQWQEHSDLAKKGILDWPDYDAGYAVRTRALIKESILQNSRVLSAEEIANNMHVTTKTLRRHLAEEGTSYQLIVDELRRDMAIEMLYIQHHNVTTVADVLGFSEARSFSRAFKKWTGHSPSNYQPDQ